MMDVLGLVTETLETCADRDEDITAPVFERFFSLSSESEDVMGHSDQYMRGRMLEQTIALLVDDDLSAQSPYLQWEVDNHRSYGVALSLYPAFFDAVRETAKAKSGAAWSKDHDEAWDERISYILDTIMAASKASATSA